MPSGGLVANHNRNQCITSTLGGRKFTVNTYPMGSMRICWRCLGGNGGREFLFLPEVVTDVDGV
jgi:hypothetical protein